MNISLGNIYVKRYIIAFITSFLITITLCGVAGILFSFFSPPDWLYNFFIHYNCYVFVSLGAFFCGAGAQKNGLMTGIICADFYMLVLILLGMLLLNIGFPASSAFRIFGLSSVFGGIAGVLGINFKK